MEKIENLKKGQDNNLAAIVHSNLGLAYYKNADYILAEEHQSKALKYDSEYHKAYFRRGEARRRTNRILDAKADFETFLKYQPNDKNGKKKLKLMETKVGKIRDKAMKAMVKVPLTPGYKASNVPGRNIDVVDVDFEESDHEDGFFDD